MKKRILVLILALLMLGSLLPASFAAAEKTEPDVTAAALSGTRSAARPYSYALLSIDKSLISKVGLQSVSGPCGCYALAYCRTILDGTAHSWTEFDGSGTGDPNRAFASWGKGSYACIYPGAGQEQVIYDRLYAEISSGNPAIVKVNSPGSQHYVAVVGFENVTNTCTLSPSNFLILDSAAGSHDVFNMADRGYSALYQVDCYQLAYDESPQTAGFSKTVEMDDVPPVVSNVFTATETYWDGDHGFNLSVDITDNVGVTSCYFDIWEAGKESNAFHWKAELSKPNATAAKATMDVNINEDFTTNSGLFLARAYAYDACGNQSNISELDMDCALSFYYSHVEKGYVGTYKTKNNNTPFYIAPFSPYNGESTLVGHLERGVKVSSVGVGDSSLGDDAMLHLEDGTWIRYGDVTRCSWWTNLIDTIKNFFDQYILIWNRQLVTGSTKVTLPAKTYTAANTGGVGTITPPATPCTVSFEGNGGTVSTPRISVFPGNSFGSLPVPHRFGYSFDGWFTAADGGSQITEASVCSGDLTLYAHWTRIVLSQGSCGENLSYILYGDGILDITGSGAMTSHPWQDYARRVLEVNFPDGLTSICDSAFNGSEYLEELAIPDSVTEIGNYALAYTGLTSLTLPKNLTTLGRGFLWENSEVKELVIPKSVTEVGVESRWIDADPYGHVYSEVGPLSLSHIEKLSLEAGTPTVLNRLAQRAPSLKEVVIPNSVTVINDAAFNECVALELVPIPDSVTSIGGNAFRGCSSLVTVGIPDSVTEIGNYAFAYSGLTSLRLPNYLTKLGCGFLWGTGGVKELTVPKTVTQTGVESRWIDADPYGHIYTEVGPLSLSFIEKLTLEPGMTAIPNRLAQRAPYLKEVVIPDSVTAINEAAFNDCFALEHVPLPVSVTNIGGRVFSGCSGLHTISIPDSVTEIGNYAFAYSGLTSLTLPKYLTKLGAGFLWETTGVTELTIPKTLTQAVGESRWIDTDPYGHVYAEVGPLSLSHVENLTLEAGTPTVLSRLAQRAPYLKEAVIPDSVSAINSAAFNDCVALAHVSIPANVTSIGANAFSGCTGLLTVDIPDSVTSIENSAFANSGLTTVELPDSVSSLGSSVFSSCTSLAEAKLSASLTVIPGSAFEGCVLLEEITLPEPITEIQASAFKSCTALSLIHWNTSLTAIGNYAFQNCAALETLSLPSAVTSLGTGAFNNCDGLTAVVLPSSVATLGKQVFYDCDALTEVQLSKNLTAIPDSAFEHCDALESIVLPYRAASIGAGAFKDCVAFQSVTIPRATSSIGSDAFSYLDRLTIYGVAGTYAETYAEANSIRFVNREVSVSSVSFSEAAVTILKGKTAKLEFEILPEGFTDEVSLKSSNTSVATVDAAGLVKAVDVGTATVKITAGDCSASCKVTVVQPVTSISLNKTSLTMQALETFTLTATVSPSGAFNKEISWSSSDESVATVDENGLVSALRKGTASITAAALDGSGVTRKCTVTVTNSAIFCSTVDELESTHKYANSFNDFWVYSVPEANSLSVSFDERTEIEDGFDYLYLFDGNGSQVGVYTGTELAGQTVEIPGDTVRIQLVSDDSGAEWGFKVTQVISRGSAELSYDANGGSGAPAAQALTPGEALTLAADVPSWTGHYFLGWADEQAAARPAYQPGDSFSADGSTTLWAVWAEPDLVLPASLTTIESEAFENGAFTFVKLSAKTAVIQNRAFADCDGLVGIDIPAATTNIDAHAFDGVTGLIVFGKAGSYAEHFAEQQGFPFRPVS